MNVGDKVKIIGDHPHSGKEGKIIGLPKVHISLLRHYDWVVRVKGEAIDCAVGEDNIEVTK
jgi:hypothetical protein